MRTPENGADMDGREPKGKIKAQWFMLNWGVAGIRSTGDVEIESKLHSRMAFRTFL